MRNLIDINGSKAKHSDLGAARISKDEICVRQVAQLLECNWVNPFESCKEDLVNIASGVAASPEIIKDLSSAREKDERAYQVFVETRLKTGTSFFDKISKMKLKTFKDLRVKITTKVGNMETILKADHRLFGRMLLIALSRKLEIDPVLCHPLGPLPWSLANADGTLKEN